MNKLIVLNKNDNVAVALSSIKAGEKLEINDYLVHALTDIPQGHKVALIDINEGENVVKYGAPIGHVTENILAGQWIHTHNLKTNLSGELHYSYNPRLNTVVYPNDYRTFLGYPRKNGTVGIRNDLYIIPTVGCVNGIADLMVNEFKKTHPNQEVFDNIIVLKHPYGCSQLGDDHNATRTVLCNAALHPNAGAVLILGLGCENNSLDTMKDLIGGKINPSRVKFLKSQDVVDEISEGSKILDALYEEAKEDKRVEVPISELRVGLKCGGSDGFSGITGNPLLGMFSDYLISNGGSTVLTEVPEMFGAEDRLMERAKNDEVFNKIVHLINDFKEYYINYGEPVYENPSPGNKDGGITTLEDKSLGCTQKSGTSAVVDVLKYGGRLNENGLTLLEGPGNDLVSTSNLASSGCQLVLFTTGRGTPFGSFVPTLKVSTNNQLFEKKEHWLDFNAGRLLYEEPRKVLDDLITLVIKVASGMLAKNEKNKVNEIAIFKRGVTL